MRLEDFRSRSCRRRCWRRDGFRDGGIEVRLGAEWHCFMVEEHFGNKRRCMGRGRRKGGLCDAIGVHRQGSARPIRLIEAKSGSPSAALPQLQKGADALDAILGSEPAQVIGEIYTRRDARGGVRLTLRPEWIVVLPRRRQRVRVMLRT